MQLLFSPILDPKTYRSPSGTCTLYIDPSDPQGSGEATYRVKKGGQLLWEGKRPFTLWDARIAEDGTVGGYAFSQGFNGLGDFLVVLLDPQGKALNEERTPRLRSRYPDVPHMPLPIGLFLDPDNDRFVVRMADADLNRNVETWWIYSLTTGKATRRFTPDQPRAKFGPNLTIGEVQPIKGTPLTLVRYRRYRSSEPVEFGAVFTLLDPEGKVVWRLELPKDYHVPGDEKTRDRLRQEIWRRGTILQTDTHGTFALWHIAQKQRVTYTITPGTTEVHETKREPLGLPVLTKRGSLPPNITLHPRVGAGAASKPPILDSKLKQRVQRIQRRPDGTWLTDKDTFAVAPDGSLAILDSGFQYRSPVLCLYGPNDTPLRMIPLPKGLSYSKLAFDGVHVVLVYQETVYCYRATGEPWWRFLLPNLKYRGTRWVPFFTDKGKTLCLSDGTRTVYRYAMPQR